ncbi:DUF3298 and DUF4163 domain-containing protein [Acidihalobacter ferrooxydans]|uniref:DUF3298 domain-containing protein n=1 Tax=Acidihalobacter ferrooxydans TaxID=1765967 RepID=A0A1P8UDF1_9GAMM|nr:DUF3298 and DUF4163 domain-containing protein [Acidihalobacter ferrooxydans]APZ41887.1 hypothetical protein BW247_01215 [Acidihalobacter ferrooxydans]
MRAFRLTHHPAPTLALSLSALLFGGCTTPAPPPVKSARHSPCDALAPATPAPAIIDRHSTPLYRYAICYPALGTAGPALDPVLHVWAKRQLAAFLSTASQPRPQPWVYELLIDMRIVAKGDGFVSVLASGYRFTGGAHGMPFLASFNLIDGHLVTQPGQLFANAAQARAVLSTQARSVFAKRAAGGDTAWCFKDKKWLRAGTAPTPQNYAIATLTARDGQATGLRLYFPPYQVAPYACGTQTVDVPARVLYPLLAAADRAPFTARQSR